MITPDAEHTVKRATARLAELGIPRADALTSIRTVCFAARAVLDPDGVWAPTFIDAIEAEADRQIRYSIAPLTIREDGENGQPQPASITNGGWHPPAEGAPAVHRHGRGRHSRQSHPRP